MSDPIGSSSSSQTPTSTTSLTLSETSDEKYVYILQSQLLLAQEQLNLAIQTKSLSETYIAASEAICYLNSAMSICRQINELRDTSSN
jgi:hypothetical protein